MPRAAASDGAAACCPGAAVRRSYRSAAAASSPSSLRDPNSSAVVHPPTSIEYELYRRQPMAAKACWLRHHHVGARHAAPAHPVDAPGAAPTHRHIPHAQAQTDRAERAGAVAGTRLALPFNHHTMRVKWLDSARACRRAGHRCERAAAPATRAHARALRGQSEQESDGSSRDRDSGGAAAARPH